MKQRERKRALFTFLPLCFIFCSFPTFMFEIIDIQLFLLFQVFQLVKWWGNWLQPGVAGGASLFVSAHVLSQNAP